MLSEKLNYIMMITKTSNTELADQLNVNQSLISKFRSGKRVPSQKSNYTKLISSYLANKINKGNINISGKISSLSSEKSTNLSEAIYNWLNSNTEIDSYLDDDSADFLFYYGDSGKRTATIKFMEDAIYNNAKALLLYSDENIKWMINSDYQKKWRKALLTLLNNGTKIKIIHTLSRNYDELLNALKMWLPLYMSRKYRTILHSKFKRWY